MSLMMRRLLPWFALLLCVALLAGCKDDKKKKRDKDKDDDKDDKSELVLQFEAAADKVCECKDMKCAMETMGPLTKLSRDNMDTKVDKEDFEQIEAASKKASQCLSEMAKKAAPPAVKVPEAP